MRKRQHKRGRRAAGCGRDLDAGKAGKPGNGNGSGNQGKKKGGQAVARPVFYLFYFILSFHALVFAREAASRVYPYNQTALCK